MTILPIAFAIMLATGIVSYIGFNDRAVFKRYAFDVDKVLKQKDYKLLVTSGFLHVGWLHLILNVVSLYIFSENLVGAITPLQYLIIFLASLLGGNLFSLLIHKNHGDYTSVGASGAVSGIMYASIALFPGMQLGILFLPIALPAWLFGLAFVLYSIYGIRSRKDNIGHESHLAGALIGLIIAVILFPDALRTNTLTILLIFIPTAIFIFVILFKPSGLLVDNQFFKKHEFHTIDHRYNLAKKEKQQEIDRILEKIHRRGMGSLTQKEKDFLNKNSKQV